RIAPLQAQAHGPHDPRDGTIAVDARRPCLPRTLAALEPEEGRAAGVGKVVVADEELVDLQPAKGLDVQRRALSHVSSTLRWEEPIPGHRRVEDRDYPTSSCRRR